MSVPKSLQPAFDGIEPLITDFCNQYLNDEYRELCLHLLEKLCRKRPSPLLAGRKNTWAAAIIYAITTNNFIFDKSQPIHLTADELCAPFGLSKSTVSNKAREIRDRMIFFPKLYGCCKQRTFTRSIAEPSSNHFVYLLIICTLDLMLVEQPF